MKLELLSKCRAELMGLSIIMIMLFHTFFGNKSNCCLIWISTFEIGVEFFAILSAIGLHYSLSRNPNVCDFYKKRLLRIVPTVLLVTVFFYVVWHREPFSWLLLLRLTTFNEIIGEHTYWFICYILLCYIIAPFWYKICKKLEGVSVWCSMLLCVAIYIMLNFLVEVLNLKCGLVLNRIPCFLFGMLIAKYVKKSEKIKIKYVVPVSVVGWMILCIMSAAMVSTSYMRFVFLLISPFMLLTLSKIVDLSSVAFREILKWLGGITLEIYLLHENIIMLFTINHIQYKTIALSVSLVCAVLGAWVINRVMYKLSSLW